MLRSFHRHPTLKRLLASVIVFAMVLELFWPYVQAWAASLESASPVEELAADIGTASTDDEALTSADATDSPIEAAPESVEPDEGREIRAEGAALTGAEMLPLGAASGEGEAIDDPAPRLGASGDEGYAESTNLGDFLTYWSITVGDHTYNDDNVDENTVIEFKNGMQYSLELKFAETADLGFATPAVNPPAMCYQLPDCFAVPSDFKMLLTVRLGRKGSLPDNSIDVYRDLGEDGQEHNFLRLQWNWEDSHWTYFRDSAQAKLEVVVNGTFRDEEPNVLSINGKDVAVRREDLHNAIVNKDGSFNRETGVIDYTVTVKSDGTTSDITLTDTLGTALTYLTDGEHGGGIVVDPYAPEAANTAGTTPLITQRTGNTFSVLIPEMLDGDCWVFRYSARVNYDMIGISGNPSFDETGNTAQIFGDSYALDNQAIYHEQDIDFSDLEKNVINKVSTYIDSNFCYILTWEIDTNKRAQYPLADTDITDTISPTIQAISKYYGDGLTVKCYTEDGVLRDTRQIAWEDLGIDLATDVSWTYHIPETDPNYHYVLTYDTIVDMSAESNTVVAENTAEGKGGISSDRAVLPPPGGGGIGVTKVATNVDSTHVTWEIKLTVSQHAFNYQRLVLTEHCGSKTVTDPDGTKRTTWSYDYIPAKWIKILDQAGSWYKESLQKVEVIGLEEDETFEVSFGPYEDKYEKTKFHPSERGCHVLEENFKAATYTWTADYFSLEFYKDFERTQGGLINPGGEAPTRTIVVRLTTEFPETWASKAREYTLATSEMSTGIAAHINWISVEAPDSSGKLQVRAYDTDKIEPMPPYVYKTTLNGNDSTLATTDQSRRYLLNYPDVVIHRNTAPVPTGLDYPDLPVFPCFRYEVVVAGIKYDEPLVFEDTFDTSLYTVITAADMVGGRYVMTNKNKEWTHAYLPKVFGMKTYGWPPSTGLPNYQERDPEFRLYGFGFKNTNYYQQAETRGCTFEKTDTGLRVTVDSPFKDNDGNLFPFYGIDYWLIPKNLEALKQIEETARANGAAGGEPKTPLTNTATVRGMSATATVKIGITNDFMPIDKSSETYLDLLNPYQGETRVKLNETQMAGHTVRDTPDNIQLSDINRYVMKYRVVLNKGRERLNDGNEITAEDEYSSNLSVDYTTINITTEPAEAVSQVSYDYSGNIGYFTIPDETKVVIEYEATILQTTPAVVSTSNEVRMLRYKKEVDDYVDHGGASGSSATNPAILVKKYGAGHMETGLNGAQFQLFEYTHDTYTNGDPNTAADWQPVVLTKPTEHYAIFETHNMTVSDTYYGHGYAEIELSQDRDGMTLRTGKVYGLREITTPVGTATNGDVINYQNPHTDDFYCYIFSICRDDETADYANYVFLPDDTMTVRNTPESLALQMSKQVTGNGTLTDTEKATLRYQVFRKEEPEEGATPIYMPIMTEERDPETGQYVTVLDSRFANITYSQIESSGVELTGLTVSSGTTVGEYLLVEYGNDLILQNHADWAWQGVYEWNDGTRGTFSTSKAYTVYDHEGQNPTPVYGIPFTVTSREIRDAENKSVSITNRYHREEVNLSAKKVWQSPSGATVAWPAGKTVQFQLGTIDGTGAFAPLPGTSTVTLDNVRDANGEETAGTATFKNLPKYASDGTTVIRYAVREVAPVNGYLIVYPEAQLYAEFGASTSVTIRNRAESTLVGVSKQWTLTGSDTAGTATLRLYSYTGNDPTTATWVSNVNDIVLDGVPDGDGSSPDFFGEDTAWHAVFSGLPIYDGNSQRLHYLVREIGCTPVSYEPSYPGNRDYATHGESISNALATTTFAVSKEWRGVSAWPAGKEITIDVRRMNSASGVEDAGFTATYVLSQSAIVSETGAPTGAAATWANGTLTLAGLQKYDPTDGTAWRYIASERDLNDEDYETTYHDKSGYLITNGTYTYNGGKIRNTMSAKKYNLTLSKTVTGNMGDRTRPFGFTITLSKRNDERFSGAVTVVRTEAGVSGEQTSTLTFENGTATVQLRHGESLTLQELVGVTQYAVAEELTNYDVSYRVDEGALVEGELVASGALTKDTSVAFVNNRTMAMPMGVTYGAIATAVALLALAAGTWVLRRRRA